MNFKDLMDEENAAGFFKAFNRVFVTEKPEKGHIGEFIFKKGEKRIVEVSSSLLLRTNGEKLGFQGIARDITEQRFFAKEKERLEEEFRQFQKLEAFGYALDTLITEGEMNPRIPILQKPFYPTMLTQKLREILDTEAG
jgi:hypothetical protein